MERRPFRGPHGTNLVALSIASVLATSAVAQQLPGTAEPAVEELEQVLVTGSRATGRTVDNSAVPIDVISSDALLATGKSNLLQALQQVLPSFKQSLGQSDLENNIPGAQLRRLSPGYTLVLVNGKRRNVSAYTSPQTFPGQSYADLSLIPTSAIDHVEVLRDGASAIYGSDAVAGVFNIILKSAAHGGDAGIELGQTFEGDGDRRAYRANLGLPLGERGFANLSAEYTDSGLITRPTHYLPNVAIYPLVKDDGTYLTKAEYRGLGVRVLTNTGTTAASVSSTTSTLLLPTDTGGNVVLPAGVRLNPLEATRDSTAGTGGDTASARFKAPAFAANLGYDLGDSTRLYAFGTYSEKDSSARFGFRSPLVIWANNPALLQVYPNGFFPSEDTEEADYSTVVGLSGGNPDGWRYDLSGTYNEDRIDIFSRNTINFGQTYTGAASDIAKTDFYSGRLRYGQRLGNLDVRRAFDLAALASPLETSFGLELQNEHYQREAGDPDGYYAGPGVQAGAQSYPSNRPEDAADSQRHSRAAYAGVAANITEPWYLDFAGRYEDHSDFGTVWSGRFTTRFDFNEHIGLRATVSNGFHAPGLGGQNFQVTKVTPTSQTVIAAVGSPTAVALGASPLQPEKSTNYSAGVVLKWKHDLKAAVDVYQIDIDNQLGISPSIGYNYSSGDPANTTLNGTTLTLAQKQQIDALLATGGASILAGENKAYQYFTNIGDFRYRGVEGTLENTWRPADGAFGRLRTSYAFSVGETRVKSVRALPEAVANLPLQQLLTESYYFGLRHNLPTFTQIINLDWTLGRWNVSVNEINNGKLLRTSATVAGTTYDLRPTWVTHLSLGYTTGHGLNIQAGASNLFDKGPRQLPVEQISPTATTTMTYGNELSRQGGYYYTRLNYRF